MRTTVVHLLQHPLPAQTYAQSCEMIAAHSVEDLLHRIVRAQGCAQGCTEHETALNTVGYLLHRGVLPLGCAPRDAQRPVVASVRRIVQHTLRAQVTAKSVT